MLTTLLLVAFAVALQQPVEIQLQKIQEQLQQQSALLKKVIDGLENSPANKAGQPVCTSSVQWVNGNESRKMEANPTAPVSLSVFSAVSRPDRKSTRLNSSH